MPQNVLVTGAPGVGKTTLVREIVERFGTGARGFYTVEVRDSRGRRRGFEVVTLTGERARLADISLESRFRVGRYGVALEAFEEVAVRELEDTLSGTGDTRIVVVDEIGRMELHSKKFQEAVWEVLDLSVPVLGVLMSGRHPFADRVRNRADVTVLALSRKNREVLKGRVMSLLGV